MERKHIRSLRNRVRFQSSKRADDENKKTAILLKFFAELFLNGDDKMKKAKKLFTLALSIILTFGCVSISTASTNTAEISINDKAVFIAEYADGRFDPERTMTKVEAVVLLFQIIADEDSIVNDDLPTSFDDVPSDAWYTPYVGFFEKKGLLYKVADEGGLRPNDVITRGEFVQLIYNIEKKCVTGFDYADFTKLVYNVSAIYENTSKIEEFSDVDYDNTYDLAIYHAVANGYVGGYPDGSFGPERAITRAEAVTIVNRMTGRQPTGNGTSLYTDISGHWAEAQIKAASGEYGKEYVMSSEAKSTVDGTPVVEFVRNITGVKKPTAMAETISTYVIKAALDALNAPDATGDDKTEISALIETLRSTRSKHEPATVVGDPADLSSYIYMFKNGRYGRDVVIETGKADTTPVEIVLFNDTHFNLINDDDKAENNPAIMSTYENRLWLADGESISNVDAAMDYAKFADQLIVAGDILDYMSHGAKEATVKNLFRRDVNMMATLGSHDTTRMMQGTVADDTSYESRIGFLADFWINDLYYASKVVQDKVMLICLDNSQSKFWESQIEPLNVDLARARENGYIVLIFEHEPICTHNTAEKDLAPLMQRDSGNTDFANTFIGCDGTIGASLEVYEIITHNADIIKGVFCGHWHSDYYTEIIGSYTDENGNTVDAVIPQYVNTANAYDNCHLIKITVK